MLFLHADDTLAEAIMPCDDYPVDPGALVETDAGPMPHADALARTLTHLMPEFGFARAIFVWERPGDAAVGDEERRWARAIAAACRQRGLVIAAQFIAHDTGVRPLAPDDYL